MINIDTVYQTVQALANKEQRGYMTPQEFNLFANQAQQDMFEQYFYDWNAARERRPQQALVGDSVSMLYQKIAPFYTPSVPVTNGVLPLGDGMVVGKIRWDYGLVSQREIPEVSTDELRDLRSSYWHARAAEPNYWRQGQGTIQVWAGQTVPGGFIYGPIPNAMYATNVSCETIAGKPKLAYWGYVVVNEKPTYDPLQSKHFDLDISEQTDLIIKILSLAGISIEDPQLVSAATSIEQNNKTEENK